MFRFYCQNTSFVFMDGFSFYVKLRCNMKITDWGKFTLYYLMSVNEGSMPILVTLSSKVMV